jgi:glycine/D-amino acid oxidase-like deaminating enzyme
VCDVLVAGGGVAGLSAALAAAEAGADVELVEAGEALGGAALLSNGSLWTFDDVDAYLAHCPGADPALARRLAGGFASTVQWLRDRHVQVDDRGPSLYGADRSYQLAPPQLVRTLTGAFAERGLITTRERVRDFEGTPDGPGVVVTTDTGREIQAAVVILATGGIHAEPAMLREAGLAHYVGLPLRNRPMSGDGARIALAHGGSLAGTPDGVYGHLVPTGLGEADVAASLAAQYQSYGGVLVGATGELLSGPGIDDHHLNRLVTRQPDRRAVLYFDSTAAPPRILSAVGGTDWAADRTAFALAHGRRAAASDSLADLLEQTAAWIDGTVSEPARAAIADTLGAAPFTAIEVEPSMTHTGTGVRVDGALHAAGLRDVVVAGADIGDAFGDGYGGGLAFALTTGIAAGTEAAALAASALPTHAS